MSKFNVMAKTGKKRKNEKKIKIFHGPVNIGRIGGYLAEYQRKKGFISDFVVWYDFTNRQGHDFNLHLELYPRIVKLYIKFLWFLISLLRYEIFNFYFGETLLPFNLDLPFLKILGKRMVMIYCGSDIRLNFVEEKRNAYWKMLEKNNERRKVFSDLRKVIMMFWQGIWIDKFVAVRNLYDYAKVVIPERKLYNYPWVNQVFDFPKDLEGYRPTGNDIPVIVHAPTDPKIKGTAFIEKALKNLRKKGYKFKYIKLFRIPNKEAQKIMRNSDIIIDQLILGGMGNLGFEALLMGKPLITYIADYALEKYFKGLPFVNANPDNIEEKIKWLLDHPEERERLGKEGYKWVKSKLNREEIMEWVIKELYEIKD